jgi:acyl-CoA reductase-like NAD-dependent aldehyde dehydrogenase
MTLSELKGRSLKLRNPRTGQFDYKLETADIGQIEQCVDRAQKAQPGWFDGGHERRKQVLLKLADALVTHRDALSDALEQDTGRRRIARLEVDSVIGAIQSWCAMDPVDFMPDWTPGQRMPNLRHRPQFVPYGLVAVISPWNFPFLLSMIDTIPALLAGCAVIIKPSEVTSRFIAPFLAALNEISELKDLLWVLPGDGTVAEALIDRADCVCFTGSVATGRKVAVQAARRFIPAFLELGGKDPMIILEGADLEAAKDAALRGSVLSTGQACQSIERIYIARAIYESFLSRLVAKANQVRLNYPDIAQGDIGPIIFDRQAEILTDHIRDALDKGAKILTGGEIEHHGGGLWLRPTILVDVTHEMKVMREETFGPILPVMAFDTVDQAVGLANDSDFGLSAAIFASDIGEAERVGRRIQAGAISLNDAALTALFSEAGKQSFKSSGIGPSRMGLDALQRFYRRKALIANDAAPLAISAFKEDL